MDRRVIATLVLVMLLMLTIVHSAVAFIIAIAAIAILIADVWSIESWGGEHANSTKKSSNTIDKVNAARKSAKQGRIDKVLAEVQAKGAITNDEVQALLGVSDATAERYLEELEKEGKIAQVGKSGRIVAYKAL